MTQDVKSAPTIESLDLTISKKAARRLMMKKQGMTDSFSMDNCSIYQTIEKLGCVQIDTISVVERAHFITLWTRLGNYEKGRLWD